MVHSTTCNNGRLGIESPVRRITMDDGTPRNRMGWCMLVLQTVLGIVGRLTTLEVRSKEGAGAKLLGCPPKFLGCTVGGGGQGALKDGLGAQVARLKALFETHTRCFCGPELEDEP